MLDHVTEFIRIGADPAVLIPAGLDDQNIALLDLDHRFDHLRRVYAGIADLIGNIGDDAGADPLFQRHLTDGAAAGIEVLLTIHVSSQMDRGVADRTVASHTKMNTGPALKVTHSQRFIVGPLG